MTIAVRCRQDFLGEPQSQLTARVVRVKQRHRALARMKRNAASSVGLAVTIDASARALERDGRRA